MIWLTEQEAKERLSSQLHESQILRLWTMVNRRRKQFPFPLSNMMIRAFPPYCGMEDARTFSLLWNYLTKKPNIFTTLPPSTRAILQAKLEIGRQSSILNFRLRSIRICRF